MENRGTLQFHPGKISGLEMVLRQLDLLNGGLRGNKYQRAEKEGDADVAQIYASKFD